MLRFKPHDNSCDTAVTEAEADASRSESIEDHLWPFFRGVTADSMMSQPTNVEKRTASPLEEANVLKGEDVSNRPHTCAAAPGDLPPPRKLGAMTCVASQVISPQSKRGEVEPDRVGAERSSDDTTALEQGDDDDDDGRKLPLLHSCELDSAAAAAAHVDSLPPRSFRRPWRVPLARLNFYQDFICSSFMDGRNLNITVGELRSGIVTPETLPHIEALFYRGKWYGMGNRRLACFNIAFADDRSRLIPVLATYIPAEEELLAQGSGREVRIGNGLTIDGTLRFVLKIS
jgi:hypothetical protein